MNAILVKLFATALTLSQVTTRPESLRTQFDPVKDAGEVVQILRDGCAHMRKAFDIEDINVDELIAVAMDDPKAVSTDAKILHGLDIGDLVASYKQFCKGETPANSPFDAAAVIAFYDRAAADLPDHAALKDRPLPGATEILDDRGVRFTEAFEANARRIPVPIATIPPLVQKAFVAAEDKRFETHKGVDERGVIRAFMSNLAGPGRPAGGSTITQQVAKNLVVGDDVTYERKIREMIVASRLERTMTKPEILGLYLNGIFLGRGAWGVEMAARSYFGKSVRDLDLAEAALLASMPKGPSYYSPDRHPERARERRAYVLAQMRDAGTITEAEAAAANAEGLRLVPPERARRDAGFYLVDYLTREGRSAAGLESLTAAPYTVRATVNAGLQTATEAALQEGLAQYEMATGRQRFAAPEANLAEAVRRIAQAATPAGVPAPATPPEPALPVAVGGKARSAKPVAGKVAGQPDPGAGASGKPVTAVPGAKPAWRIALESARLPLYDVHWPVAVVLDEGRGRPLRVGLADGRIATLNAWPAARAALKPYDVVMVRLADGKAKAPRADLRARPAVQGAALVLENRTGRILAMSGGFSYPLSQLNRVTQAVRQPGSTLKPLTYLAALNGGLQPNTLVLDAPVTLPPIGGTGDSWSPKNYEGGGSGPTTLRRGLEHSKNLVTARLLQGGIADKAPASLQKVCDIALEAQLYAECERYYPFVLGAQPVRMIDLATFYAAVANEGARPQPYGIVSVTQGETTLYRHADKPPTRIGSADRVAFYQLKTMLQGVVARGTAASLARYSAYLGGKTGTSEDENDAWFAGFTNDVTIVVWAGYDNAGGERRTLGRGRTGGTVAVPIAGRILEAAFANGVPRTPLSGPSPEARPLLADAPIDLRSGGRVAGGGFLEHFRRGAQGEVADTRYKLLPDPQQYAERPDGDLDGDAADGQPGDGTPYGYGYGGTPQAGGDPWYGQRRSGGADLAGDADALRGWPGQAIRRPDPYGQGAYGQGAYGQAAPSATPYDSDARPRRPRRRDPDYPFDDDPTW